MTRPGVVPCGPRVIILAILVDNHVVIICAKYEPSRPYGFREEEF